MSSVILKKGKTKQPYYHQTRFLGFNLALEAITSLGVSGTTKSSWYSFTFGGLEGFNSDGESNNHSTIFGGGFFSTEREEGEDSW